MILQSHLLTKIVKKEEKIYSITIKQDISLTFIEAMCNYVYIPQTVMCVAYLCIIMDNFCSVVSYVSM